MLLIEEFLSSDSAVSISTPTSFCASKIPAYLGFRFIPISSIVPIDPQYPENNVLEL